MTESKHDAATPDERLGDVLAAYLEATDAGWAPDRRAFVTRYPALRPELEARGVRLVGISADEDVATVRAFVEKNPLPFESYFGGRKLADTLAEGKVPTTFLVNEKGVVIETLWGALDEGWLRAEVDEALGPKPASAATETR